MCVLPDHARAGEYDDDDPDPCNYTTELQAEFNAFVAAQNAYAQDQSQANCLAFKNSLLSYVDAAADLEACVPQEQKAAFEASVDEAQVTAAALPCQ